MSKLKGYIVWSDMRKDKVSKIFKTKKEAIEYMEYLKRWGSVCLRVTKYY